MDSSQAFTVSQLTARIKGLLELNFPEVWVTGEVSNLRQQSSGHWYFTLKDDGAQISCVMFRGDAQRSGLALRNGMAVVGFGRMNVFEVRGNYQIVFRTLLETGLGRLQQAFEALKRKLADEGLFATDRKQSIPKLPGTIGFVTSPTGAALRDFVSILQRRDWRGRLVVLPVRVQGKEAADEIAEAIEWAGQAGWFDLLVVGRGGGSLEDLWPFNEEQAVRAVAACPVPVISAVGHEIDYALTDFAADMRAETPSAAAELISSAQVALLERLNTASGDLAYAAEEGLVRQRQRLALEVSRLQRHSPELRIENAWLRLDEARAKLDQLALDRLGQAQRRLDKTCQGFQRVSPEFTVRMHRERLTQLGHRLDNLGVDRILARGFSILWTEEGEPVASKADLKKLKRVNAQMIDGRVPLEVVGNRRQREFDF